MYGAALPVAVFFFLLWHPPELSEFGLFVYLTVVAVLVRIFITLYEIPSSAIVAELTDDYDERTRLLSYRYMWGWFGGLFVAVLNWGIFMVVYGATSAMTYEVYGAVGSVIIFIAIVGSSVGLHKYIPYLMPPPVRRSNRLKQYAADLRETLSNRNFAALFLAGLFAALGHGVATNFDTYIVTHFWEFTAEQWRWVVISLFASAVVPVFLTPMLTARWDKKRAAMGIYGFQICFAALPFILRLAGWFPENDSAWLYPIIWAHTLINVVMVVSFGVVQSSMLADIVEHSEMSTGRREEGLFFASRTFAQKAASGGGAFIAGVSLDFIEFPTNAQVGEVAPSVIWDMGFIYGPMLMLFYFLALGAISYYRITREGHDGRVAELRGTTSRFPVRRMKVDTSAKAAVPRNVNSVNFDRSSRRRLTKLTFRGTAALMVSST